MNVLQGVIGIIALYLFASVNGQTNNVPSECRGISRGRDFVVAFTNNLQDSVGELHILVVAFSDNPTRVTISSKHQVDGQNYQTSFDIPAHGFQRTTIPYDLLLQPTSGRSKRVLRVTASSEVSVYGMNYEAFTTDAFLALPNIHLGTQYVATSIRTRQNGQASALIAVVGLEDTTEVFITLTSSVSFDEEVYNAGDILSFIVNSDEVVQIVGLQGADLSGSIIHASSPVVAYGGHQCASTASSACDILSEQLIPVNSWGKTHIYTATGSQNDVSIFRIFVFFEGTTISVPGFGNRSLNSGEFWEVELRGNGVISSNFPSKVVQILRFVSGSLVDPSIIQVPSEEQFAFVFGFSTPPKAGGDASGFFNFINIVVKAEECDTVTTNGEFLQCDTVATPVPETDYVVVIQQLPKGEGVYFVEQSSSDANSPMSVIVYGYENHETYGYAAGLSLPSEGRLLSITPFVVHENGGDVLTTTLPCVEQKLSNQGKARCRFRQASMGLETIIDGTFKGFYQVLCPTFPFKVVGLNSLDVSIDGGATYPYSATIYVASQDVVPSKVTFDGFSEDFEFIDLTKRDKDFTIRWNPIDFEGVPNVQMSVIVLRDDDENGLMWGQEIALQQSVINSGSYTIDTNAIANRPFEGNRKKRQENDEIEENIKQLVVELKSEVALVRYVTKKAIGVITENREGRDPCTVQLPILRMHHPLPQLPFCPCNFAQAMDDDRYELSNAGISFFHQGARNCYRRQADGSNAGVQCCYNGIGELILNPKDGAGSADAVSPTWTEVFTDAHFQADVVPWVACCLLSNLANACEMYFKYRPPTNCDGYTRPGMGNGAGDPHIITLDQKEYTFNGAGEFTLLQSTLHDVIFQGRMAKISGANASVFTAFAVRGERHTTLQVERSTENQTLIIMNGTQLQVTHDNKVIPKFTFDEFQLDLNFDLSKVKITFNFGLVINIGIFTKMMSYTVFLSENFKGETRGLLGNFNGDPNDDFILPSGEILAPDSSLQDIHYEFALKWGLDKYNSIFTYLPPNDFEVFNQPDFVPNFKIPSVNEVSNDIKDACGSNFACLFDAVNSGDISLANQTLSQVSIYHERRENLERIVNCWFPENFENGKIEGGVYYVNLSYKVSCLEGYYLIGSEENYCASDGQWSNEFPSCISNWILFGLPGGIAGSLILILILILTVVLIKRCCCSQKNIV